MIPIRIGTSRNAIMKSNDSLLRQHNTDITRLWQLQTQTTDGTAVGGDVPGSITGGAVTEFQGESTADLAAPADGWGAPTTVVVTVYAVTPGDTSTPRVMVATSKTATLVNRDPSMSVAHPAYFRWIETTLSDGSVENVITWAECKS